MKKVVLMLGAFLLIVLLTSCGSTSSEIATMRGGKIRVDDLYKQALKDPTLGRSSRPRKQANEQVLREMIIKKVFMEAYGEKVTKEMIDEAYKEQEETHGGKEQFEKALKASGLTKKIFQNIIKENLAIEVGLKANMEIGKSEINAAWEDFHPSVDAQLIKVSKKSDAEEILNLLQEEGVDFDEVAKEQSEHKETKGEGGKISFDSLTDSLPSEVKNAAFSLENGELSDMITVTDSSTKQTSYYIVKMISNEGKGNDQKAYLEELTKIAQRTLLDDPEFVSSVFGKELEEAEVEIKDKRLKDLLSDYKGENNPNESKEDVNESS
ncbi:peptidylprolyl isomerase [Enterococcus sp. AZ046]|uniref:peptidylprolyl isomerase n=1 Tax=Enterococcus sp. AZ046 TaxID=2774685 RepID=UPI003D271005